MNTATWNDSALPRERALGHFMWSASVSLTLLLAIVSGGSSQAGSMVFGLFRLLCLVLFAAALVRLLTKRLAATEMIALLIIAAAVSLVCLQLVPLPYGVFMRLPGRDFVARIFDVAGIPPQAMPMTLSPEATRAALLALVPPITLFLATLTTEHRQRWLIVSVVMLGSVANVFLGLAQRFEGASSNLYFYDVANFGSATGFFSNRNNFAMLLCVTIPLTWAVTHKVIRMRALSPVAGIAGGALMMLIIFMGLAASNSRSGILLGMLALTLSTLMVLATPTTASRSSRRTQRGKLSLLAILGAAFIIGQFGMTGILRIVESDPLSDLRSQMRAVTLRAAAEYFPVGSGFGTFQTIYGMHETPAMMFSAYVNHAHNDWLELWLEGGLPAAALMACFVALFAWQVARVWNPRGAFAEHVLPRAASIGALVLLLHSLVEFPLRMPALLCIFASLIAILLAPPQAKHPQGPRRRREERADDDDGPAPAQPAIVTPPVFRVSPVRDAYETRDFGSTQQQRRNRT